MRSEASFASQSAIVSEMTEAISGPNDSDEVAGGRGDPLVHLGGEGAVRAHALRGLRQKSADTRVDGPLLIQDGGPQQALQRRPDLQHTRRRRRPA